MFVWQKSRRLLTAQGLTEHILPKILGFLHSSHLKFSCDPCGTVLAVKLTVSSCFHPLISAPGLCAKLDSTYADPPPVRSSHDVVLQHLLTPPSTRACLQINFRPITALKLWHIYTLRVSIIPPMSISSQYFPCFVRNLRHVFLKKANLHLTESVNVSLNDHHY